MTRRIACCAAFATLLLIGSATGVRRVLAAAPAPVDAWAWCGVNPDDPAASEAVQTIALAGGIDATFGPCNDPKPPYTPAFTSNRYVLPDVYMRLVKLNATVGMKTVVYDKRLWSPVAADRNDAIAFWQPVLANIAAWDMGDEFDPAGPEWSILKQRWTIVLNDATARTGIKPFTNVLPNSTALDKALADLPGMDNLLSFAQYNGDLGAGLARSYDAKAKLMCGVNTFDFNGLVATAAGIRANSETLRTAGCDQLLIFGGFPVYDTAKFGDLSITDRDGQETGRAPAAQEGAGHSVLIPIGPLRLLETRIGPGLTTADGNLNGIGIRPPDSVLEVGVVGRVSMPSWAQSVVLNVTVSGAIAPGFLTVYPCGQPRPVTSNLNYDAGVIRAAAVTTEIGSNGAVCVYTQTPVHVVVDITGYYAFGASFLGVQPARLLDTRVGPEFTTVDSQQLGIGRRPGGSITEVKVTGRGGVPTDASAVAVNLTAINPSIVGFATVFPCGEPIPLASTLNFVAKAIVPNSAIVKVGAGGSVCVFSNVETDFVLDVNGYHEAKAVVQYVQPTRLLETRSGPGLTTADGQQAGAGVRPPASVLELTVGGRVGVPTAIKAAVLNITVTEATGPGYLTVYPCDAARPNASTLNYDRGTTVANLTIASTTKDGKVCIYTQTPAHVLVDLSGYHT
jgi:hypothetical protein